MNVNACRVGLCLPESLGANVGAVMAGEGYVIVVAYLGLPFNCRVRKEIPVFGALILLLV